MENDFGTYEQALALKELDYDEMCFGFYRNPSVELMRCRNREGWMGNQVVAAPLKQQVFRWFREKYNLAGLIHIGSQDFSFSINKDGHRISPLKEYLNYNGTYEEAENACIDKLIELVKQQENDCIRNIKDN
jgi:hypothetical protein